MVLPVAMTVGVKDSFKSDFSVYGLVKSLGLRVQGLGF